VRHLPGRLETRCTVAGHPRAAAIRGSPQRRREDRDASSSQGAGVSAALTTAREPCYHQQRTGQSAAAQFGFQRL